MLFPYKFVQAQNDTKQSSGINTTNSTTSSTSSSDAQKNNNEPNCLEDMVGYRLQIFKNIHIPSGNSAVYIAFGEQYLAIPESARKGMPFLKIQLAQPVNSQNKLIDNKTIWTIKRAHNNLCIVDDPSIDYIELHINLQQDSTQPWFFILAAGNAIDVQHPNGKPLTYTGMNLLNTFCPSQSMPITAVSTDQVDLHDFSIAFSEEISREKPFSNGYTIGEDNKYDMRKFPYPNWYYWTHGVAEALTDIWLLQSAFPPGKVITLGRNFIVTPKDKSHIRWHSDTIYNSIAIITNYPSRTIDIAVTINKDGKVKAKLVDCQFPKDVGKTLVASINKLNRHPAIIFPTVFPSDLSADEYNLAIDKQHHYMGVTSLPNLESVSFICTFHNNSTRK